MYDKIFIDLDGVLADFDRGVSELCGIGTEDTKRMWDAVNNVEHFYLKLQPVYGAVEMFTSLRERFGERLEVISVLPRKECKVLHAEDDKRKWVSKTFGDEIVVNIVHNFEEMKAMCTGSSCILYTKDKDKIGPWVDARGIGAVFLNPKHVMYSIIGLNPYKKVDSMFGTLIENCESSEVVIGNSLSKEDEGVVIDKEIALIMTDDIRVTITYTHDEDDWKCCYVSTDKKEFDDRIDCTFEEYMDSNGMYLESLCENQCKWAYCGSRYEDNAYRLMYENR